MGDGSGWIFVLEEGKLGENSLMVVYPKGLPIILVKKEGRIYAMANKCPHMGCPLGGGTLDEYTLKCPCHDWKFDITTGQFLAAKELRIPIFPAKVSEGKVFLNLDGASMDGT